MYKPVEIDIADKRLYAQIAFLVDSLTFLDFIERVRKKFSIHSLFKADDYDSWNSHILSLAGYNLNEYWDMNKINPKDKDWERKSLWMKSTEQNFLKHSQIHKDFMDIVVKIRKIHHYPTLFDDVIIQAILFHRISAFKTAKAELLFHGMPISHDKNDPALVITLSPNSSKEDILEAFEESKKLKPEYELTNPLDKKLDADTLTHIKRTRDWHWQQLKGDTYSEVADAWNKKIDENSDDYIFDVNKIEQAVARYRRNLQVIMPKTDV